jgi:hypothetical protein
MANRSVREVQGLQGNESHIFPPKCFQHRTIGESYKRNRTAVFLMSAVVFPLPLRRYPLASRVEGKSMSPPPYLSGVGSVHDLLQVTHPPNELFLPFLVCYKVLRTSERPAKRSSVEPRSRRPRTTGEGTPIAGYYGFLCVHKRKRVRARPRSGE